MAYRQQLLDKLSIAAGEAKTCRPDQSQKQYAQNLEKRLSELGSILNEIADTSSYRERGLALGIEEDVNGLRERLYSLKESLEQLKLSGGNAWQELGKGVSSAMDEITKGIKAAVEKIK